MYINFIPIRPKTEFIDLLDTLWYIFVKEDDIDFVIFCRIFKSKEVNARIIFEKLFNIFFKANGTLLSIEKSSGVG